MSLSRARRWADRYGPVLVLGVVCALFFWRFFTPEARDRVGYEAGDFTETFYGFHQQTYAAFVAGRWADWADCLWSGYPLGADPQAQLFYPPKWVTFVALRAQGYGHFPFEALTVEVAAHYLILSLGTYAWLRGRQLRRGAALLGAVVFAYGGYAMSYAPLQSAVLMTATWLPSILWMLDRFAERGRARDLGWAALASATAFYAGHPQTFLHIALLSGLYWLYRLWQLRRGRAWAAGATALLAGFILALIAAQLAPTVGFNLASTRASITYAEASTGFPFVDPLQMIVTGVVSHWHPLFVGLLPLGLAVYALRRPSHERWFWLAVGVVGLLLSFGERAGWTGVLFNLLPGWDLFRGQERLAVWVSFAMATLAAFGGQDALGPLTRAARRALARSIPGNLALWAGFGLLALSGTLLARLDLDRTDWRALPDRVGVMWLGASLALAFWLLRAHAMRWTRTALPALVLAAVVTELYAANRPLNIVPAFDPTPPSVLLEPALQARDAAPTRFFRISDDRGLPGHVGCLYGLRHIDGRTPIKLATYAQFRDRLPERVRWSLLGVAYVVTGRAQIDDPGATLVADDGLADGAGLTTRTYRLAAEPQRAWLSHTIVVAASVEAVLELLPGADDLFGTAWLVDAAPPVSPAFGPESISVLVDTPGHIQLAIETTAPAVVTVSEAFAPGWRATLNGQPAEVRVSDGALIGIALPVGSTTLDLTYAAAEIEPARWASAVALLVALALVLFGGTRRSGHS